MPGWLKSFLAWFSPYAKHIDPPVTACVDRLAAMTAALQLALTVQGGIEITTGTPSMVPIIPAAPTYLAIKPTPFGNELLGRIGIYRTPLSPTGVMCHRFVAFGDATSFIASGDNNRYSEPQAYVRVDNLIGEVIGIFTFPPPQSA